MGNVANKIEVTDNFGCGETLAKAVKASHYCDIRVRVDGRYCWFQADFMRKLFQHVVFVPGDEIHTCRGREHHIGDRFGNG